MPYTGQRVSFIKLKRSNLKGLRPNLKNLICLVSLKIVFNVSRFKPALNWNRFLGDLRRGSNSLNSDFHYLCSLNCFSDTNLKGTVVNLAFCITSTVPLNNFFFDLMNQLKIENFPFSGHFSSSLEILTSLRTKHTR